MKKTFFSFLVVFMLLGSLAALASCKNDDSSYWEKETQKAKDSIERIRELKKEADEIMKKP